MKLSLNETKLMNLLTLQDRCIAANCPTPEWVLEAIADLSKQMAGEVKQ